MLNPNRKTTIGIIMVGLMYAFATGNIGGCVIPSVVIWLLVSYKVKPNV